MSFLQVGGQDPPGGHSIRGGRGDDDNVDNVNHVVRVPGDERAHEQPDVGRQRDVVGRQRDGGC